MDLGWFEVALNVTEIKRSLEFYQTLGFELGNDAEINNNVAALYKDDCSVTLYQGHLDPARPQLIFWQGDVAAIAADLTAKGVEFFRPLKTDDTVGGAFMLLDPDGHPVFFIAMNKYADNSPVTGPDGKRIKARQYPPNKKRDIAFGTFVFSLPVSNPIASRGFYKTLGLRRFGETNTLASNDCRIGLFGLWLARPQLIFWGGNVDAIESELSSRGLKFQPHADDGRGKGAMLFD